MSKFVSPEIEVRAFTCPSCGTLAQQVWSWQLYHVVYQGASLERIPMARCRCVNCQSVSFWSHETRQQVYPASASAPMPHVDMPVSAREDYLEARTVAAMSPRSAAALLRLSLQKLLSALGCKGKNIDEDIGFLVSKGLPVQVKDALDICRVIGNNAVHPGELNVHDEPELVAQLFELMNFIVAQTIERERHLKEMMAKLPQGAKDAIERRDSKAIAAASPVPPGAA